MREIVKEVSGYVLINDVFCAGDIINDSDGLARTVLLHMSAVSSNCSEIARTSVPVSSPRSGYVKPHPSPLLIAASRHLRFTIARYVRSCQVKGR